MTTVTMDDIIFRLQAFGGASDFWSALSSEVDRDDRLSVDHVAGHTLSRLFPVRTTAAVLHSSHFRVPANTSTKCVTTIHDLTYELDLVRGAGRRANLWQRRQSVARADAIVCISDHTRNALTDYYADELRPDIQILTIPHGRTYDEPRCRALPEHLTHDVGFVLHVGNRAGYKNFETALRAYARSALPSSGVQLWCTGSPFTQNERDSIAELGLTPRLVRDVGKLTTEQLGAAYEQAIGLIYPSAYEGFGLPPLDAMSLGCPVIAADNTSVPEVVGDAAMLVNPIDEEGFSRSLEVLLDPQERDRLIGLGRQRATTFNWADAASAYAQVYLDLGS